jgi:dynein heavy chain 1
LEASQIRWALKSEVVETNDQIVQLPVYLNEDRSDLLFILDAKANKEDRNKVTQGGVAVVI